MPLSSPFQLTALSTVLSLVAAATIVAYQPGTAAPAAASEAAMAGNVVNTALRP